MGTQNIYRGKSALHLEGEALRSTMENMLQYSTCQNFGINCKDLTAMIKEPHFLAKLCNRIIEDKNFADMIPRV